VSNEKEVMICGVLRHMPVEDSKRTKYILAGLFVVGLCLRLSYLWLHGPALGGDAGDYLGLAHNITSTGLYGLESPTSITVSMAATTPTIRRAPTYPVFLALIGLWKEPTPLRAALVQIILDSIISTLIFLTARIVVKRWLAIIAALLYALNPGAIITSVKIMSESLFTFLLFGAVILIGWGIAKDKVVVTGLGGIVLGIAILCRAIAIPLPVMFIVSLLFMHHLANRIRHSVIVLACATVVLAPWSIRCSIIAGSLVTVQGASAINFYIPSRSDLNQQRDGELYAVLFGPSTNDLYGRKLRGATTSAEIVQADRVGYVQAIENIKLNPQRYLISRLQSFPHLFMTSHDNFTGINTSFWSLLKSPNVLHLCIKTTLLMVFSALPLIFAILSVSGVKKHPIVMLCMMVWMYNLLIHIPMWIEYRFWHPVVPCLLICGAVGVTKTLSSRFFLGTLSRPFRKS
jgi:4-amino-4-deoxy-L-arabinose transferase-like glycosyltransferase